MQSNFDAFLSARGFTPMELQKIENKEVVTTRILALERELNLDSTGEVLNKEVSNENI